MHVQQATYANVNIDLARAKSEALVDICSLQKQNMKSCNANQAATATKTAKKL